MEKFEYILSGENYKIVEYYAKYNAECDRAKSIPKNAWRTVGTPDDPYIVNREGLMAEITYKKFLGLMINKSDLIETFALLDMLTPEGKKIQIKKHNPKFRTVLIRTNEAPCDIYVVVNLISDDRVNKIAVLEYVGWFTRKEVTDSPTELGKKKNADWYNYAVDMHKLHSIYEPFKQAENTGILKDLLVGDDNPCHPIKKVI